VSRSEWVAPEWRTTLPAAETLPATLRDAPSLESLPGQWQAFRKAGLGGRERWRWTLSSAGGAGEALTLFVKRFRKATWREQWDRWIRQNPWHSRGWWEYHQAEALAEASIAAPRAVVCAERMLGPFERRSVVCLSTAPGEAFDRAWAVWAKNGAPITCGWARHDLTIRLARFVSAFHHSGRCHRDLYLCHIFVEADPAGAAPAQFALIDLTRVFSPSFRRMRWVIKDLSQLDASARQLGATRSDRLRFLRAYLGLQRRSPRVRVYARRTVRKSDAILARDARKRAAREAAAGAARSAPR
jgi:hypothetical protein